MIKEETLNDLIPN
jgi:hypothetical protein